MTVKYLIVKPDFLPPFEISDEKANVIAIEKPSAFFSFAEELNGQADGDDGMIVLSSNGEILKLSSKMEIIKEFIPFEINSKRLVNKLYAYFERKAMNGEYYNEIEKLNSGIMELMKKLTEAEVVESEFGSIGISALFKAVDFRLSEEQDSLEESVINYMLNVRELDGERIFVILNMLAYVDEERREALFETIADHRINALFLEPRSVKHSENVNQIIIDEDLCVI